MQIVEKLVRKGWSGNHGLYVSVIPDKRSKDILEAVARALGVECDFEDLHCTLVYSQFDAPKELSVWKKNKKFKAKMQDIKLYGKNSDHLVVTLDSPELKAEHDRLIGLGAKHSWEYYSPHVTLCKVENFDDFYLQNVADAINGRELTFEDYSWDDLDDKD